MATPNQSYTFNAYQSNLSGPLLAGLTTVALDFIPPGLGVPAYLVIDPDVPASREYIKVLAYTGNTIDNMDRNLEGSAGEVDHLVDAVIRAIYTMQMLDDTFFDIGANADALVAHIGDNGDPHEAAGYVKEVEGDARWVELAGDTMIGLFNADAGVAITGAGIPDQTSTARIVVWDLATGRFQKSADQYLGPYLPLAGGTLTGGLISTAAVGIRLVDGGLGSVPFSFSSSPTSGMYLAATGVRIGYEGVFHAQFGNGQIQAGSGTQGDPSFSFQAAPSSGMYYLPGSGVRIVHQGNFAAEFDADQILGSLGSAALPSISFQAAPSSGMYYVAGVGVRIATAGLFQAEFSNGGIRTGPGTVGLPSHSFQSDSDTGMYRYGTNAIGFSAGNSVNTRMAATSFFVEPVVTDVRFRGIDDFPTTGNLANVWFDPGNGRMYLSTSARKYKSDIQSAAPLADLPLEPVTFHHDGDGKDHIGFIANDIPDERAIRYDADGEVSNYDLQAVVAILAAKVNRLESV